ncbi:hypothetical protein U1Q18_021479 [Sarracenia purpurea var. burkii]
MAAGLRPSKSTAHLSSRALEKFIKTQKNLSKPPPRLWADSDDYELGDPDENLQVRTLTLNHPILRTLESCNGTSKELRQVHAQLIVAGLFQYPLAAGRLVKKLCSAPPSMVSHAVALFDRFEDPDAFICNTIVRSLVNSNDPRGALAFYYQKMVGKSVSPNNYTFPLLAKNGELGVARGIFNEMPERDAFSWNSIIAGYVAIGDIEAAKELFEKMPFRDVVSWNSLIDGDMMD